MSSLKHAIALITCNTVYEVKTYFGCLVKSSIPKLTVAIIPIHSSRKKSKPRGCFSKRRWDTRRALDRSLKRSLVESKVLLDNDSSFLTRGPRKNLPCIELERTVTE